jgi:hypothetical protein
MSGTTKQIRLAGLSARLNLMIFFSQDRNITHDKEASATAVIGDDAVAENNAFFGLDLQGQVRALREAAAAIVAEAN